MNNIIRARCVKYFGGIFIVILIFLLYLYNSEPSEINNKASLSGLKKSEYIFFAHMGLSMHFPENSMLSLIETLDQGISAVEIDIRITSDNQLILFHDENCLRLLGLNAKVEDLSFEELKLYSLIFDKKPTESTILTLENVLETFKNNFIYYLDLKVESKDIADGLSQLIQEKRLEQKVIVANSNIFFLAYIEYKYPEILTALEGFNAGDEWVFDILPDRMKPDYYASFLKNVDADHMEWIHENNLLSSRIVYGVDSCNLIKALSLGLQNIILDYDTLHPTILHYSDLN